MRMGYYRGTADGRDQAKALFAVAIVHAALAAVILSGLNVQTVRQAVETLKTFDIKEPAPPPPAPPPPQRQAQRAKEEEGAAGKRAEPSPIVAPKPRIVLPAKPPVAAAPAPGTGSATTSGAATYGTGPGAGGTGTGRGGGGTGDFTGFSPARMINKIPDREYRRISGGRLPFGSATISFRVNPDGRMSNCRITRSSGDPYVDSIVCEAATRHLRFRPARDPNGRAVAQDMTYTPTWRPN
jgi:periplasmic protein TonB